MAPKCRWRVVLIVAEMIGGASMETPQSIDLSSTIALNHTTLRRWWSCHSSAANSIIILDPFAPLRLFALTFLGDFRERLCHDIDG